MSGAPIDPRREKHRFRKAAYNGFYCGYCSAPRLSHKRCGHSIFVDGCTVCADAVFSRDQANYRRRRNLRAMLARGVRPTGVEEALS